jgi:hypothetical protein
VNGRGLDDCFEGIRGKGRNDRKFLEAVQYFVEFDFRSAALSISDVIVGHPSIFRMFR